jgi:multidrug efflux system membrane fusion protein
MTTRSRRFWGWLLAAVVVVGVVFAVYRHSAQKSAAAAAARTPEAQAQAAQARAVPVSVATAARQDVPIYLEGLGNVSASMTVTVKTQLDGRLDQVLFKEGQAVKKGQLLAQIDPRPYQVQLAQAEGAQARDDAQLKNARVNVERDRQLVADKLIAQQQLDTDAALVGQLEGTVQVDKAAIDSAKLNLDYARITSPIDGITGVRQVDPGNVIHAADAGGIVIVTKLDPIAILFTLPQDQLSPVLEELHRTGTLAIDAYSRDGSTLLGSGKATLIDNQINQATSTIRMKGELPNPRLLLWPNQFVNVRLHLTVRKDAVVIPAIALQRGPAGSFVYVVASDDTVTARPIEIAITEGDTAVVKSGVQPDERVVTDGQNQLRPGAKVSTRAAAPPKGRAPASPANDGSPKTTADTQKTTADTVARP